MTELATERPLTILELIQSKAQDLREAQTHVLRLKTEIAAIRKGLAGALGGKKRAPKTTAKPAKKSRRRGLPTAASTTTEGE